jgi:hypothetical protein
MPSKECENRRCPGQGTDYGLLNPAWPGVTPVTLKPGEPLVLRYRLWIHRGDVAAGGVQQAYDAYRQAATK